MSQVRQFPRSQTERTIAAARIAVAGSGLLALWLGPAGPEREVAAAYTLHALYALYSLLLAGVVWNRSAAGRLPLVTHLVDIILFSVFQYLPMGPSSPLFVYFTFSLFCGALRWRLRGTFGTAMLVLPLFLIVDASTSRTAGTTGAEANRFILRALYLAVTAGLLVYLGQHETRLRVEIERLARWPSAARVDRDVALQRLLEHAVQIVGAQYAVVAWEAAHEPWMHLASRSPSAVAVSKHAPGEIDPVVPPPLADAVVLCATELSDSSISLVKWGDATWEWHGLPLHVALMSRLSGTGVASAPFHTEQVSGRVFFSDLGDSTAELMWLTEVVARQIGTSIDQLHVTEQLKDMAASEQRIRLARDLHDGLLQSLTGIRFEVAAIAASLSDQPPAAAHDRLLAVERAMAREQRELRLFIDELKPVMPNTELAIALASRLDAMGERLAMEWKTPITLRTHPRSMSLSEELEHAILLMTHEAIVNALKHAHPSRISVDVRLDAEALRIAVTDDGRGFGFRGRYDHAALSQSNLGPVSLRERADSLGGEMTIESTNTGSRVEITVPATAGV
jgi:signal transduction histidine kinase